MEDLPSGLGDRCRYHAFPLLGSFVNDDNPFKTPSHSGLRRNHLAQFGWATLAGVGIWIAVICTVAYVFDAKVEEGQLCLHYSGDGSMNTPYDDGAYYDSFVYTPILTGICFALILLGVIVAVSCCVAFRGRSLTSKRSTDGKPA